MDQEIHNTAEKLFRSKYEELRWSELISIQQEQLRLLNQLLEEI